ncbi:20 kDa chaperonin, chloroplastic [Vitis vinifera]|uniref:20 kDa chaperonin, chloroplastic n=1 Tax=Vitis vinifera TaxID=29760 RepID=A0A438E8K3_VITVI|nr:20 kDa chaperonin, chloroplastic [Vitis vinifera]
MERSKPALSEEMPDLEKRKRRRIPLSKLNCKKVPTPSPSNFAKVYPLFYSPLPASFRNPVFLYLSNHSVREMATAPTITTRSLPSFEGLRPSTVRISSMGLPLKAGGLTQRSFRSLVVRAATVVTPKRRRLSGGILLPTTAQTKPQGGEVVAVGEGKTIGKNKLDICVKTGAQVVYSKYTGTEVEFNGSNHLILKEDDIVGILETDDVKDLKPLNDRVLIKVAEAEEKTAGGLLLTEASKEKPSIGTVVAVGPGPLDEDGKRKPLSVSPGNTVLYSKYAGNDFKGSDGSDYIALKASDIMAVLS